MSAVSAWIPQVIQGWIIFSSVKYITINLGDGFFAKERAAGKDSQL